MLLSLLFLLPVSHLYNKCIGLCPYPYFIFSIRTTPIQPLFCFCWSLLFSMMKSTNYALIFSNQRFTKKFCALGPQINRLCLYYFCHKPCKQNVNFNEDFIKSTVRKPLYINVFGNIFYDFV